MKESTTSRLRKEVLHCPRVLLSWGAIWAGLIGVGAGTVGSIIIYLVLPGTFRDPMFSGTVIGGTIACAILFVVGVWEDSRVSSKVTVAGWARFVEICGQQTVGITACICATLAAVSLFSTWEFRFSGGVEERLQEVGYVFATLGALAVVLPFGSPEHRADVRERIREEDNDRKEAISLWLVAVEAGIRARWRKFLYVVSLRFVVDFAVYLYQEGKKRANASPAERFARKPTRRSVHPAMQPRTRRAGAVLGFFQDPKSYGGYSMDMFPAATSRTPVEEPAAATDNVVTLPQPAAIEEKKDTKKIA